MKAPNYKLTFYQDMRSEWRWRIRHRNRRIIAESGEGYKRRGACVRAISNLSMAFVMGKVEQ